MNEIEISGRPVIKSDFKIDLLGRLMEKKFGEASFVL